MGNVLLEIRDLHVAVGGREILRGVELTVPRGEVHVLFGPNGSGKSTLLAAIMGLQGFTITRGTIRFRGERIDGLAPDAIARLGIGLAFQRPPVIRGVRLETFIRAISRRADIKAEFAALHLDALRARELNLGFSGGELKRSEILKLYAQSPALVLLDEPESGVDLENIALIAEAIRRILHDPAARQASAGLIITHTGYILDYVAADRGHVFLDGRIVRSGDVRALFQRIRAGGYGEGGRTTAGGSHVG